MCSAKRGNIVCKMRPHCVHDVATLCAKYGDQMLQERSERLLCPALGGDSSWVRGGGNAVVHPQPNGQLAAGGVSACVY